MIYDICNVSLISLANVGIPFFYLMWGHGLIRVYIHTYIHTASCLCALVCHLPTSCHSVAPWFEPGEAVDGEGVPKSGWFGNHGKATAWSCTIYYSTSIAYTSFQWVRMQPQQIWVWFPTAFWKLFRRTLKVGVFREWFVGIQQSSIIYNHTAIVFLVKSLPYEQWKKPWLVVWYRGLYYPVIWGS